MKGKKLSVALVSTFIAALGMTSCSNITLDGTNIVTLTGYDGKTINIDANEIYNNYKSKEDGISSFYKAILEVLIRNEFETNNDLKAKRAELFDQAQTKVKGVQETAQSNADSNGTKYSEELDKLLKDTYHVENIDELLHHFLYLLEKEEIEDRYFKKNLGSLTNEYIGFKKDGSSWVSGESDKHASMYPYHIKHILVKTSASKSDYVTGEITSDEAKKINTVYSALVSGKSTFGDVAYAWSEDGSAVKYGDAGIMDTATSFVSEFKLGTYAFDAVLASGLTGASTTSLDRTKFFGLNEQYAHSSGATVAQTIESIGLNKINYKVFNRLGEFYDVEKSDTGLTVNDGVAKYYPRNIYWNHFLNKHQVSVIVNDGTVLGDNIADTLPEPTLLTATGKTGFRELNINGTPMKVLTDECGRVIYLVRSEYGIHFMVMQRTPFEFEGTVTGREGSDYTYNDTLINEYYTTFTPGDKDYPQKDGEDKITYVNLIKGEKASYKEKADATKKSIKGFDSMYDYRIFEEFIANDQIKINDELVEKEIKEYIEQKRSYNKYSDEKTANETWESYLDMLQQQKAEWDISYQDTTAGATMHRYVNLSCVRKFKQYNDPTANEWIIGGECYYAK